MSMPNQPASESFQLSTGGNPIQRSFTFKSPDDWRIKFHKHLGTVETYQEPYCQVEYGELKDGTFMVVTFCEGDLDFVSCKTQVDLDRELKAARDFYDKRRK